MSRIDDEMYASVAKDERLPSQVNVSGSNLALGSPWIASCGMPRWMMAITETKDLFLVVFEPRVIMLCDRVLEDALKSIGAGAAWRRDQLLEQPQVDPIAYVDVRFPGGASTGIKVLAI